MASSHSSSETVATLKLLLIGSSGTGKSSLLMRFVDGVFLAPDEITATIGVDFKVKVIDVEGKKYKLTIWVSLDLSTPHSTPMPTCLLGSRGEQCSDYIFPYLYPLGTLH
jgi:hypothetical protein